MITVTGWTFEYIDDHMTVPRLRALSEYWEHSPPVHVLVAAYMGVGKKDKATDLGELMSMFPEAQGVGQ